MRTVKVGEHFRERTKMIRGEAMPIYKMSGSKDGKQKYRIRINYIDPTGKYKQVDRVTYGKAEAQLLETRLLAEIKEAPPQSMTVRELYNEYMAAKKSEVRATTYDKNRRNLELYILPEFGDKRLDKLTLPALQEWKTKVGASDLKIRSKQNIFKEFSALLNYAVKMEYIQRNPLNSLGNFKDAYFQTQEEKLHYYTPEQFKAFITAAANHVNTLTDRGYYVFFNIAFYTGMMKGEINALRWSDIEGNIIHVRRSVTQKLKGEDVETPPKNKSSIRDLQMPDPLIEILAEHKEYQRTDPGFSEDYRVCGGVRCLRDTSLAKKNEEYAKEAGLPIIRIHDFRHTHVSLLANEGINIQEVARRLGHSKIEMTWNTYSHLYPREEERAVKILNKIRGKFVDKNQKAPK